MTFNSASQEYFWRGGGITTLIYCGKEIMAEFWKQVIELRLS
jgi:hypothetical protein